MMIGCSVLHTVYVTQILGHYHDMYVSEMYCWYLIRVYNHWHCPLNDLYFWFTGMQAVLLAYRDITGDI